MFRNYHNLDIFDYICAQNAQCWARIIKSDMEIQRYNRLKAAIERAQSEARFDFAEREQARTQFKIVQAEKERTGTWLSEQMGHSISTVSRWMTNRSALCDACQSKKGQPSVEPLGLWTHATNGTQELYEIARHLDVDVKELLVSSK